MLGGCGGIRAVWLGWCLSFGFWQERQSAEDTRTPEVRIPDLTLHYRLRPTAGTSTSRYRTLSEVPRYHHLLFSSGGEGNSSEPSVSSFRRYAC